MKNTESDVYAYYTVQGVMYINTEIEPNTLLEQMKKSEQKDTI